METIVDIPHTGRTIWALFVCLLLPPIGVTLVGMTLEPLPHQTIWVIALGVPALLMLISLPRRYRLLSQQLIIDGFVYRVRVPLDQIVQVQPIAKGRALLHPGSVFCSDPARALLVQRDKGRDLVISPADPGPFLALQKPETNSGGES